MKFNTGTLRFDPPLTAEAANAVRSALAPWYYGKKKLPYGAEAGSAEIEIDEAYGPDFGDGVRKTCAELKRLGHTVNGYVEFYGTSEEDRGGYDVADGTVTELDGRETAIREFDDEELEAELARRKGLARTKTENPDDEPKCSCGCSEFYAHQLCRMDVITDGRGEFLRNLSCGAEGAIYDSEKPYGPFTCVNCGKEYDEIEDLPKGGSR